MPLILNVETATQVCSVCLSRDGEVIDYREDTSGNSHARVLTTFINQLFTDNNLPMADLSAVAVSAGPGSYTGLRIGTSVAKGLCYALNIPLIAVPTLQALAAGIQSKAGIQADACYMPMIDARRMDAYVAVYDSNLNEIEPAACLTLANEFENKLKTLGRIYIGGNAMEKCKKLFSLYTVTYTESVSCDSRNMVQLSRRKYHEAAFENTAYFEPHYMKEFTGR
jgi:tRNA threonylcarbamoyladenosine biosynthesis protein TsaB